MGKLITTLPTWLVGDITGAEELGGFNERADAVAALDGTDLNAFWQEIQDTIRLRNAQKNRLIDLLTVRVTDPISLVQVPSEASFEKASEYGQPVGIRGKATRLWRGYDFDFYDLAIRYTWMYIAEASQDDLRNLNNLALEADTSLLFRKVMNTMFNPLNVDGITDQNEPITVYKFYNADGEIPPVYRTATFAGTHSHYLVSGGATVTSVNLDSMSTALGEHGYTLMAGYKLVLWANKQETDVIKTFRVATGAQYDFVPNPNYYGGAVFVPTTGTYVGGPSGVVPGEIGTYGAFHVVEEPYIPAGYLAGIATGGPDNLQNPIGLREHKNPTYRGLKIIPGSQSQYPLLDSFYRRGFGTGIRQRGAGVVMQVKASGNYAVPSAYATV
jgi:hypothetical protein